MGKEEGSTKEIVGKVHKERSGTIWLEKRECRDNVIKTAVVAVVGK